MPDRPKTPLPCPTCPWRTDRDAATIPNYDHARAVGLLGTVGRDDALRPIMACHGSMEGRERPCLGYLAREGWRNLAVRLDVLGGRMPGPAAVVDACEAAGIELEPDYPAVLAKLARGLRRPARRRKAAESNP